MIRRRCIFFAVFFLFSFAMLCGNGDLIAKSKGNGRILGFVFDNADDSPLGYVNVYLEKTKWGTTTNERGFFDISSIPPGKYNVIVRMMGYAPLTIRGVNIRGGKIKIIKVKMTRQVLKLQGVNITADRATQMLKSEHSLADHQILKARDIIKQVGALEDPQRALSFLPSVVTRNDMNTQLYIRGGSPDQNLVTLDGIEILNPSRLFVVMGGGVSVVNPDLIEAIDLAPGGFGVDYGNKLSALMRITTREGNREKPAVSCNTTLVSASAIAEGPFSGGRGSWLVEGRRSFYDIIANGMYSQNYVFPYFYDVHSKIALNLTENNKFTAFYTYLGEGAKLNDYKKEQLDLLNQGNGSIWGGRLTSIMSPKLATNLLIGGYFDNNSVNIFDTFNYNFNASLAYRVKRYTMRSDLLFYPANWFHFKTGTNFNFNTNDILWKIKWRNFVNLPESINYNTNSAIYGAYWQMRLRGSYWFELTSGLRYDYSTLFNEADWSPRAKLVLSPHPNLTTWLNWGVYSQYPDILTIMARGEPMDITKNNMNLGAERAVHEIAGMEWRASQRTKFKLEIYKKDFDRLLLPKNEQSFIPQNSGVGLAQGIEFTFQIVRNPKNHFGLWFNYSYSEAKYRNKKSDEWTFFDYDQRNQFASGLEIKLSSGWSLSSVWRYGTGFPYTPVQAMRRDPGNTGGFVNGWEMVQSPKNSARYPDYSRLDIRLTYTYKGRYRDLSAYIDFMNVLNHNNVYLYEWDFYGEGQENEGVGRRSVYYMMPFIPSFGLSFGL